jgi:hypothetical protein
MIDYDCAIDYLCIPLVKMAGSTVDICNMRLKLD